MRKTCPICDNPNVRYVDRDLSYGFSLQHVSLKHFGDYLLVNALGWHKRFHLSKSSSKVNSDNVVMEKERFMDRKHGRHSRVSRASEDGHDKPIIAVEAMRIKGVVYKKGESIPEFMWTPAYLSAALRAGTVRRRRKAS